MDWMDFCVNRQLQLWQQGRLFSHLSSRVDFHFIFLFSPQALTTETLTVASGMCLSCFDHLPASLSARNTRRCLTPVYHYYITPCAVQSLLLHARCCKSTPSPHSGSSDLHDNTQILHINKYNKINQTANLWMLIYFLL